MARVKIKVTNMNHQGEDIFVSVNAKNYQIKDGAIVSVPQEVVSALNDAVYPVYKIEGELGKEGSVKTINRHRFHVSIIENEREPDKSDDLDKLVLEDVQKNKVELREKASVSARE